MRFPYSQRGKDKPMNEFIIFTDGDVDLPDAWKDKVTILPQYYYFEEDTVYGDELILPREEFFERFGPHSF